MVVGLLMLIAKTHLFLCWESICNTICNWLLSAAWGYPISYCRKGKYSEHQIPTLNYHDNAYNKVNELVQAGNYVVPKSSQNLD